MGDALPRHPVGLAPADVAAGEGDRALLRLHGPAHRFQHRRLAGSVGAQDGDDLALGHVEAHPPDRRDRPVVRLQVAHRQQRLAHPPPSAAPPSPVSKAMPSTEERTERHGLSSPMARPNPVADKRAKSDGVPRWGCLVARAARHPHPMRPATWIGRCSRGGIGDGRSKPRTLALPPRRIEGKAFDAGGGETLALETKPFIPPLPRGTPRSRRGWTAPRRACRAPACGRC